MEYEEYEAERERQAIAEQEEYESKCDYLVDRINSETSKIESMVKDLSERQKKAQQELQADFDKSTRDINKVVEQINKEAPEIYKSKLDQIVNVQNNGAGEAKIRELSNYVQSIIEEGE